VMTPTCVMIVWGDGSVTTVHPPHAPIGGGPPGKVATVEPRYPG
jgi:hypothetical protein